MLNNKGFAVSAVLYTLLILFLVFLGVSLSMFSASNNLISYGNRDLVDGTNFEVNHVCTGTEKVGNVTTNVIDYKMLIRIKSKYGTHYWPRDFVNYTDQAQTLSKDGKIKAVYEGTTDIYNENHQLVYFNNCEGWAYKKTGSGATCRYILPKYITFSYNDTDSKKPKYDNADPDNPSRLQVMTGFKCGN